jgi:hypothetical protein
VHARQAWPRHADPLLELRVFRSVPFCAAIVMALWGLCAFGAWPCHRAEPVPHESSDRRGAAPAPWVGRLYPWEESRFCLRADARAI